jgi:hypothetical protein
MIERRAHVGAPVAACARGDFRHASRRAVHAGDHRGSRNHGRTVESSTRNPILGSEPASDLCVGGLELVEIERRQRNRARRLLAIDQIAAASRTEALASASTSSAVRPMQNVPPGNQFMPASTAGGEGGEVEVHHDEVRAATSRAPPARWGEPPSRASIDPNDCARVEQLVQPVSLPYPRHRRSAIIRI